MNHLKIAQSPDLHEFLNNRNWQELATFIQENAPRTTEQLTWWFDIKGAIIEVECSSTPKLSWAFPNYEQLREGQLRIISEIVGDRVNLDLP